MCFTLNTNAHIKAVICYKIHFRTHFVEMKKIILLSSFTMLNTWSARPFCSLALSELSKMTERCPAQSMTWWRAEEELAINSSILFFSLSPNVNRTTRRLLRLSPHSFSNLWNLETSEIRSGVSQRIASKIRWGSGHIAFHFWISSFAFFSVFNSRQSRLGVSRTFKHSKNEAS